MALVLPLARFPETAGVREGSGLPWGCVVQPLSAQTRFAPGPPADALARCDQCYGYVHWLVRFDSRHQWPCSFCGHTNAAAAAPRYATPTARQAATELRAASYESVVDADAADGLHTPTELVYILLVDLEGMPGAADERTTCPPHARFLTGPGACIGSPAYLAQVKLALQAAMETLPSGASVAMVSYAQTGMVVHDLGQTQRAHAKVVPATDARGGIEVPLHDVVSLAHARRTIQHDNGDREAMAMATQALDQLVHSPQLPRTAAALAASVGHVLDWVDDAFPDDHAAINLVAFWTGCHQTQPTGGAAAHDAGQFDLLVRTAVAVVWWWMGAHVKLGGGPVVVGGGQAQRAIRAGVTVTVCGIQESPLALAAIEPLPARTGGCLLFYTAESATQLPGDLHRTLSLPWMYRCFLRVRTSPGFRVARAYGALQPDEDHAGLYTIVGAPATTAVALDFELDSDGFRDVATAYGAPTVQLAFSYVGTERGTDGGLLLVRRLRILTMRTASLAPTVDHLLASADPASVLCLVLHKVTRALHTRGLAEARLLLQDWLSSFVTRCVRARMRADGLARSTATLEMILEQQHPHLTFLLRYVYGLLLHPLLAFDTDADQRVADELLLSGLNAAQLAAAVYPRLTAYDSAHAAAAHDFLPLSRHALVHGGHPFFLLDGTTWLVLYLSAANADLNARPGKDTMLGETITAARTVLDRPRPPVYRIIAAGSSESADVSGRLIDDHGFGVNGDPLQCSSFEDFRARLALLAQSD